jgi:hypothetical protein
MSKDISKSNNPNEGGIMKRKEMIVLATSLAAVAAVVALLWTFRPVHAARVQHARMHAVSQAASQTTAPPVAPSINYQGQLTGSSGSPVDDGVYTMTFSIYDDPSTGSPLWTQASAVTVTNGLFDVALGSIANPINAIVFPGGPRWLGVQVDPDPEMTPRQLFHSVPYAITAEGLRSGGATSDTSPDALYTFANNGSGPALVAHGDVHINGDLTWYTRTGHISISPSAFQPHTESYQFARTGYMLYTTSGDTYNAPVSLPDGSTVTKVTFYFRNSSASEDVTMSLRRGEVPSSTIRTMAQVNSIYTTAHNGYANDDDDIIDYAKIDNENYKYWLQAEFDGTGSTLQVTAVVIEYQYSEPY